jgi:hypothetical protein
MPIGGVESAHRAEPRLQSAVVGFDAVVGVLLGYVQGIRDEFVEDP